MDKNSMIKKWAVVATIILLIVVGYLAVLNISRKGETKLSIEVIPGDSTLKLNDKNIKPGIIYLKPGIYTITANKEGFKEDKVTVELNSDPVRVGLVPMSDSVAAKKWLTDNPAIQLERERIGGERAALEAQTQEDLTPLIQVLPYKDPSGIFRVDYGSSQTRTIDGAVFIDVNGSNSVGRKNFVKWLAEQGQDPTDLEIQYTDFHNPFFRGTDGAGAEE